MAHQLLLSEEFEQAGVMLHIVTMPATEKTPESQLLSNVRGVIAEYERAKILERTRRGLRGRAKEGYPPASGVPLGYRYIKHASKGGHYETEPEEAALVRDIFRWYVEDGMSMHAIVGRLIQENVPTPWAWRGKAATRIRARNGWHVVSVRTILRSETYTGTFHYGKKQSQPGKRNPDKKTRWRDVPREEWIPIPVPVIVEPELFQAA
jgi:site-specific DNA recombinase